MDLEALVRMLDAAEIDVLLQLYYLRETSEETFAETVHETVERLIEQHLVSKLGGAEKPVVRLTDEGLSVCSSVMFHRVQDNVKRFRAKTAALPERAVSCLVNRILWHEFPGITEGYVGMYPKPYAEDENLWYERVVLQDKRMRGVLDRFYTVLESLGFVQTVEEQRWCSPEVEAFLKEEYTNVVDLSWAEEDALKYYFFFYIYAQGQKNLIDFSGEDTVLRSLFFGDDTTPPDYWYSTNRLDPRTLLSTLGISEARVLSFLEDMQQKTMVNERYYPLPSFSFFSDEDKLFVIKDIKAYMELITHQFLTPVVDALAKRT